MKLPKIDTDKANQVIDQVRKAGGISKKEATTLKLLTGFLEAMQRQPRQGRGRDSEYIEYEEIK